MLGDYTSLFAVFAKDFEVYLNSLSQEGAKISDSLELGSTMPFDVTVKLKESLERSLQSAQELITAEELRVTTMLDDFVSDEVSERITERRTKVSTIWAPAPPTCSRRKSATSTARSKPCCPTP